MHSKRVNRGAGEHVFLGWKISRAGPVIINLIRPVLLTPAHEQRLAGNRNSS